MANDNKQTPKQDPEQVRRKKEEQARASRRRSRQLVGVALSILILLGAVYIVQLGIGLFERVTDDTELRAEYEHRIKTLVWLDTLPFNDPRQADQNFLKTCLIWGIFADQQGSLSRNEDDNVLIPSIQLDLYAASLFGPTYRFEHASFYDETESMEFDYDEEAGAYIFPVTSLQTRYLPSVVEIQREPGGVRRVVVGYVQSQRDSEIIQTPDYDHPVRYMDYLFRRDGNEYYLYAVERNTTMSVSASGSLPASSSSASEEDPFSEEEEPVVPSSAAVPSGSTAPAQGPEGGESAPANDASDEPADSDGQDDTSE